MNILHMGMILYARRSMKNSIIEFLLNKQKEILDNIEEEEDSMEVCGKLELIDELMDFLNKTK